MKICYLTQGLDSKSGWGRYAWDLISGVKQSGCTPIVLKELDDGYEGIPILKRGQNFLSSIMKARDYVKKCDVLHALDIYPYGVMAYFARAFSQKPLVISAQGTYAIEPFYTVRTSFVSGLACRSADTVVAISRFTKAELLKKVNLKNVQVINHGVNAALFYQDHLPSEEDFILSVGALKYRKGYHISIPAFALARQKYPCLKYKIVGDQSDRDYFNQLRYIARQNNILEHIEFLSQLSDGELRGLYQKARLFLLTALNHKHSFEGFGLVFLEAAAAGLPVIGTLGNGIEDAVRNGYNGLLVEQGNVRDSARAMSEILSDKLKWQTMSANSHAWAKNHSLDKMIGQYIEIYKSVL